MLLAIDIGNTSIAIGVYEGADLVATFRTVAEEVEPTETEEEAPAAPEVITKGKADEEDAEGASK